MDESAIVVPKRPWIIKVFVAIFGLLFGLGLIVLFFNPSISREYWAYIYNLIGLVSIIGIWQGRLWARNLFLVLMIPWFVIAFFLAVSSLGNLVDSDYLLLMFRNILGLFLMMIPFSKPAQKWFDDLNPKVSKDRSDELSWQFQLMIVIASTGITYAAMSIGAGFDFIPLAKELNHFKGSYPSYLFETAYIFVLNIGFLIGSMAVIFPFGFFLGYWRKRDRYFYTRLITFGAILAILTFPAGREIVAFMIFFLIRVSIIATAALSGLVIGEKVAQYIDTLRAPMGIK